MKSVIALLLGALTLSACQPPGAAAQPPPASHPAASPASPGAGAETGIAGFLPEARRFVELHRGLKFKLPVTVEYLDDAAFEGRLLADQRKNRASTDSEGILLRAVGLIDPTVDVELAFESLLKAGVIGYYDPRKKELAIRGTSATVQARHALVHELTHALQDQWFGIDTPDDMDGDAEVAFRSVLEGDARRIEQLYIAGLSAADRGSIQHEGDGGLPSGVPPVLIQELGFPYQAGAGFLLVLEQQGGQAAIDTAFKKRPVATAQVMQPSRFLAGFAPREVSAPAVPGTPTSQGVFGNFRVALILSPLVPTGVLDGAEVRAVLSAWQGDHLTTWRDGGRDCVAIIFQADGPAGEAAMVSALTKYAATQPGAAAQAGPPRLTACARAVH